uniref:Dendritic cell-specific transmembrane protein-like domain-containing protein n=1 Tax=Romanomermis culicivorax TaxID=13658 RepID=A0A915HV56_ROMCU
MVLSYGMFFSSVRCWFLLMIPEFMSSRCRAIIILLALGWTLSGPVLNSQMNLRLSAETVNCLHEQVGREGQNLKTTLKNLLLSKANKFFLAKKAIELFMLSIKSSFKVIFNALNRLVNIVKKTFGWMEALVGKCNSETQSTYQICCDKVEKVNKNCKYYLGKIYLGWLCPIITLSGDYVCGFFKISQYLCSIPQAMQEQFRKHVLDRLKNVLEKAIDRVEKAFDFEVKVSKNYTFNETFISNATEFKRRVQEEINYIRDKFSFLGGLFDLLIYVAFLRLMLSAFIYRRKYLTKLRYDNYFLTQELFHEDLKKSLLGKETALPLTPKENNMYIFACSCRMTKSEFWRMTASFITLSIRKYELAFFSFFFIGFWLIFDWATWFCLSEQYRLLMELGGVEVPNFFKLHVQGSGMMAKVYKYLLSAVAPETFKGDLVKRWQICIEEPSIPDFELHKNIYIMMLICYITLPIGVYLARLRHVICYLFYPEQEIKRAIELQNIITVLRGSWLYFLQKSMDDKKSTVGAVKQRLFVSVPLLGKIVGLIGDEMKTCTECYEQVKVTDINNYRTCENTQCGQSPNCTRCQQPKVPKGMIISYEMPQSEETMQQFAANLRKKYDKDVVMQRMDINARKLLTK